MIVAGEHVAKFVSDKLGFGLCPPYVTLGLELDGELMGGIIFSTYEGCDIRATVAGSGWTRAFLKAAGAYVFGQLECQRCTFVTEQPMVIDLVERMGGQVEGRLRNHFGYGRDGILLGVLKEEYRWYKVPRE